MFDLAEKLDQFQHPIESGLKVANMGTKTFRFEDGDREARSPVQLFARPSGASFVGLLRAHRGNRTGLHRFRPHGALRQAGRERCAAGSSISAWSTNAWWRPQQFLPLLDRIAKNESYLHIARERAAPWPKRSANRRRRRKRRSHERRIWRKLRRHECLTRHCKSACASNSAWPPLFRRFPVWPGSYAKRASQPAAGAGRSRQQPGGIRARARKPSEEVSQFRAASGTGAGAGEDRHRADGTTRGLSNTANGCWRESRTICRCWDPCPPLCCIRATRPARKRRWQHRAPL